MIKKSWRDISIKDYKKIVEISKRELDSDLEKDMAVCALLNGISEDEMYEKTLPEAGKMLNEMAWIKEPFDFNKRWSAKHLNINGKKCRMYQSLESLTMAQYLDFENYWQDKENNQGKILACLIVPENHNYNEGYDLVQFQDELERTLSIVNWNEIAFFLLKSYYYSTRASLKLGIYQVTKMIWKTKDKTLKKKLKEWREVQRKLLKSMR